MSRSSAFTDCASPLGVGTVDAVAELLLPAALPVSGVEVSVSSAVTPRITSATANSPATAHLKRRSQDRMRADAARQTSSAPVGYGKHRRSDQRELEESSDPDASRDQMHPVDDHTELRLAAFGSSVADKARRQRKRNRACREGDPTGLSPVAL